MWYLLWHCIAWHSECIILSKCSAVQFCLFIRVNSNQPFLSFSNIMCCDHNIVREKKRTQKRCTSRLCLETCRHIFSDIWVASCYRWKMCNSINSLQYSSQYISSDSKWYFAGKHPSSSTGKSGTSAPQQWLSVWWVEASAGVDASQHGDLNPESLVQGQPAYLPFHYLSTLLGHSWDLTCIKSRGIVCVSTAQ